MDWSHQDVSMWLTENGFDKYIDKFKEEEIDGLSLLNLSSSSIDELLSIKTVDNVIKKPTIGSKTTFEKKLEVLKTDMISSSSNIMTLNDKQSDVLIQEINSSVSNNLSFFHNLSFDTEHVVIDNEDHLNGSLSNPYASDQLNGQSSSNSYVSDQLNGQSSSNPTFLPPTNVAPDETIHRSLHTSSIISISQPKKKKQQLIKTIRDDVVNSYGVDFYPTASEFDRMIVSVKNKYPALSKVFGEDMSLLTSALKQQFSRERQQYGCVSDVLLKKRQSYGHLLSGRKLKFTKVDLVSHREYLIEEKEQSEECLMQLAQQADSMRVLINTTNYDYSQVKAKMDITYPHRQRLVREMKPIKQIVTLYPALAVVDLIVREINVHCDPFDGDIVETLKSSFTKLLKYLDHPQKENITTEEQPFFILEHLIMKRFKHSKKLLLNHETLDAYPMINIQKIDGTTHYSIVIEYNQLITTNSQAEAMAILIGSYEVFNIEYPTKIRATLEVLNGLSFKKRSFFLAVAAKRFFNEYKLNIEPN
ncbi:unnamed protein product [Rotaria socialis]|uniref:SAM domain-containing protein n=1 Tax=Rotaria socialis TaxID=392032 RepID=A0A820WKY9_9BILA|nr:unnamed protein product [Rotaria socialis]